MQFRCPNCQHPIRIDEGEQSVNASQETVDAVTCPSCNSRFSLSSEGETTFSPKPGMKIGHFDVLEVLGEGAFGTVFKCFDTELNRLVAVKVPREGRVSSDSSKLFLREARAAAAINHPNVIAVYEVGQHEDRFYIASEFIDGVTLSEILKLRAYSTKEAAELMVKLLRAVQVFHDKGIVHRDMKSGNILIDTQGEPHIADFGLARREGPQEITVTHDGKIIGTPAYMSPEQARGDTKAITTTSDQYSLGVIFYELLTRDRPFHATNSRTLLHRILTEQPRNPRSVNKTVPVDLDTICVKALEKDPAQRYASVGEMTDDIQRFLDGRPISARPASPALKLQRWALRNPMVAALSVAVCVLLIIAGMLLTNRLTSPEPFVRVEAPKGQTHLTRLTYTMNGNAVPASPKAKWAIVPLDEDTMEPIENRIQQFETENDLLTPLAPGFYLVVIEVIGFGFHEVFRRIPEDPLSLPSIYSVERWETAKDGVIQMPSINVWQADLAIDGMVFIDGGSFEMGYDEDQSSTRHLRKVESFYLDATEVTLEDFENVFPREHSADFDSRLLKYPKTMVNWMSAAMYAEAIGKRLPTEAEFEFAATNRGTTTYPWGNDSRLHEKQELTPVNNSGDDTCITFPIHNLCSNAAEWTLSSPVPFPGATQRTVEGVTDVRRMSRVVRGGAPDAKLSGERSLDRFVARRRNGWFMHSATDRIGFRCARSSLARSFQKSRP